MKKHPFIGTLFSTLVLFMATLAAAASPEIGKPAPDFTLPNAAGKMHKLSDSRGKIVVLEWTSPECPFTVRHYDAKTMTTLYEKYSGRNVVWLAIDSNYFNTPERSQQWAKERAIAYPILQDPDGKVGRLYEAKTTPHMFVVDTQGNLAYKGAIDNDRGGSKSGAELVNYVDAALQSLLDGKIPAVAETKPYGCSIKYR